MLRRSEERPTGSLGLLYDEVASYAKYPIKEIERITQAALTNGYIDDKIYFMIKDRLPFHDAEHKTLGVIGDKYGVGRERIRALERDAYTKLRRYRLNEEGTADPLSLDIIDLPWDLVQSKGYGLAINGLYHLTEKFGRKSTAGGVLGLLEDLASQGKSAGIYKFKQKSFDLTRKVFKKIGKKFRKSEYHKL